MPSMVVTALPATSETGVMQDRVASPSTWTVQAPHRAMPQPNLVPVMPNVSLRTHNRGVLGSTLTSYRLRLTVRRTGMGDPPEKSAAGRSALAAQFGEPPAQPDEKEAVVFEEFRRLAFEGVADELENPAPHEHGQGQDPQPRHEQRGHEQGQRKRDQRNADGVAEAVDRMAMAGGVLRDPLLAAALAYPASPLTPLSENGRLRLGSGQLGRSATHQARSTTGLTSARDRSHCRALTGRAS